MKRAIIILIVVFGLDAAVNAQEKMTFTLGECLEYAFGNSNERQTILLSKKSQELNLQQAKLQRVPSVSAGISESFGNNKTNTGLSGSANINASMPIYQGGEINATIQQQQLQNEQADASIQRYDDNLSIQILQAFLTILGNKELIKYQQAVVKSSLEAMKQGEQKFKVGSILESDYLLLVAQHASDTNNIIDTQISIENSLLSLKSLMSMDPLEQLDIVYPDTTALDKLAQLPTIQEAIDASADYSPSLKISQYDIEIAKKSLKIAKAGYYPSVNLSAGISTGHFNFDAFGEQLSDRLSENVGISVSIPIYSRGSTKIRIKQNEISLRQSELDHAQNVLDLRQTVAQAYHDVVSAYNSYNVTKMTKDAYLKSFEAYNAQFSYGSITAVELLQQQNNYLNALNKYIQSKYSFILQRKMLDVYMGNGIY